MNFIDFNDKQKSFGKLLFFLSILISLTLIISPLTNVLFHIDEFFTLGLIKHSFVDNIIITSKDFHPPLYYVILKVVLKVCSLFNIHYLNTIFILKMITIAPYFVLMYVSGTKIRREYGWLEAGLFVFTLITMSDFYLRYLNIRMYSWALLFLVLSFIYLKDVIMKSDVKSWMYLILFTLCGAYTHYVAAISSIILFSCLFIYLLLNNKSEIKKWLYAVSILIICYLPWISILLQQINEVHQYYWIEPVTINTIINILSYFVVAPYGKEYNMIFIIFLVFFISLISHVLKCSEKKTNFI